MAGVDEEFVRGGEMALGLNREAVQPNVGQDAARGFVAIQMNELVAGRFEQRRLAFGDD